MFLCKGPEHQQWELTTTGTYIWQLRTACISRSMKSLISSGLWETMNLDAHTAHTDPNTQTCTLIKINCIYFTFKGFLTHCLNIKNTEKFGGYEERGRRPSPTYFMEDFTMWWTTIPAQLQTPCKIFPSKKKKSTFFPFFRDLTGNYICRLTRCTNAFCYPSRVWFTSSNYNTTKTTLKSINMSLI